MKEGAHVVVLGQIGQELGVLGLHGLDLLGKGDTRSIDDGYVRSEDLLELDKHILSVVRGFRGIKIGIAHLLE